MQDWWTNDELALLGWQWAPDAMQTMAVRTDLWKSWVAHANARIDPTKTTDSKMGRALTDFVRANAGTNN
jgi:hypothetical protein